VILQQHERILQRTTPVETLLMLNGRMHTAGPKPGHMWRHLSSMAHIPRLQNIPIQLCSDVESERFMTVEELCHLRSLPVWVQQLRAENPRTENRNPKFQNLNHDVCTSMLHICVDLCPSATALHSQPHLAWLKIVM
jgi:hypothetical protein